MKRKLEKQRIDSSKKYIDDLSQNCSKLNIVRVDLGYKKSHCKDITYEEANKDIEHLFNNMRSKPSIFKDKKGHIIKKELGEDKGIHFHCMFIFDGNKVQRDIYKGNQIGEYWNQITKDKGVFHNCNINNYENNGIGMLDYKDTEKRKILDEHVIPYLCKEEQEQILSNENKKDRAFIRGVAKNKDNIGRPRKKQ